MSTAGIDTSDATATASRPTVAFRLEVVVIPVADTDRAMGVLHPARLRLDADFADGQDFRIVQFTPPGCGASVQFGSRVSSAAPGSAENLYLVVDDIDAARADLADRGVEVSEVFPDGALGDRFHPD